MEKNITFEEKKNGFYNVLITDTETLSKRALFTKNLDFISSNVSDDEVVLMKDVLLKNQTLLQDRIEVLSNTMLRFDNKFHTMEELRELYPDKWVVVEKPKLDKAGFTIEGELIAVGNLNETGDFAVECKKAGRSVECERTSEKLSMNFHQGVFLCEDDDRLYDPVWDMYFDEFEDADESDLGGTL